MMEQCSLERARDCEKSFVKCELHRYERFISQPETEKFSQPKALQPLQTDLPSSEGEGRCLLSLTVPVLGLSGYSKC